MKMAHFIFISFVMSSFMSFQDKIKNNQMDSVCIEIKQIISGESEIHVFVYKKKKLSIYKSFVSKNELEIRKKVYSKKIKGVDKIFDIERKIENIVHLKNEYINAQLGGIRWEIDIIKGKTTKKIVVHNFMVVEIQILADVFNSYIPNNKPQLHKMQIKDSTASPH